MQVCQQLGSAPQPGPSNSGCTGLWVRPQAKSRSRPPLPRERLQAASHQSHTSAPSAGCSTWKPSAAAPHRGLPPAPVARQRRAPFGSSGGAAGTCTHQTHRPHTAAAALLHQSTNGTNARHVAHRPVQSCPASETRCLPQPNPLMTGPQSLLEAPKRRSACAGDEPAEQQQGKHRLHDQQQQQQQLEVDGPRVQGQACSAAAQGSHAGACSGLQLS